MARVDPYVVKIPRGPMVDGQGNITDAWLSYFTYSDLWKHNIWKRTGGGTDSTEGLEQEIQSLDSVVASISSQIKELKSMIDDINESDNLSLVSAMIETKIKGLKQQIESLDDFSVLSKLKGLELRIVDIEAQL